MIRKIDPQIKGQSAWTPVENTYYHFLTFDLGERRLIRRVATAGRRRTHEYVTEFVVQFSDDGENWRSYVNPNGEAQVKKRKIRKDLLKSSSSFAYDKIQLNKF